MGEMLRDQEMNKGEAGQFTGGSTARPPAPPTLAEVGITKSMSSRAQKIACFIVVLVVGVSFPVS